MAPGKMSTLSCPTCPWYPCTLDMPSARNVLVARRSLAACSTCHRFHQLPTYQLGTILLAHDCRKLIPRSVVPHARQQSSHKKSFSQNHSVATSLSRWNTRTVPFIFAAFFENLYNVLVSHFCAASGKTFSPAKQ